MRNFARRWLSVFCMIGFLLQGATVPAAAEENVLGTLASLKGWDVSADYGDSTFFHAEIAKGIAYSGEKSLHLYGQTQDSEHQWAAIVPRLTEEIDSSEDYTVTFYAKGGVAGLIAQMPGVPDVSLYSLTPETAEDEEKSEEGWKKYSIPFPAGGTSLRFAFRGKQRLNVYLDDFKVTAGSSNVNLAPHGGFEDKPALAPIADWTAVKRGITQTEWDMKTAVGTGYRGNRSLYVAYEKAVDAEGNNIAGTSWLDISYNNTPALTGGTTYQITFYGKYKSGNLYLNMGSLPQQILWPDGASPEDSVKESEGWKKYCVEVTPAQDNVKLAFRAQWTTGVWYLDDIEIRNKETGELVGDRLDFEETAVSYEPFSDWKIFQGGPGSGDTDYTSYFSLDTAYEGRESFFLAMDSKLNNNWAFNNDIRSADARITEEEVFGGSQSLYVNNRQASGWSALRYASGSELEAGKEYTLTFYAKIINDRVRMMAGGATVMTTALTPQNTDKDGWKRYSTSVTPTQNGRLYFDFQSWIKCEYYIDDIRITYLDGNGTESVIMNEDFESDSVADLKIENQGIGTVEANKNYTFSFYAKGDIEGLYAGTSSENEKLFTAEDACIPENSAKAEEGWRKYSCIFPVGGSEFTLGVKGVFGFTAYLDDIRLTEEGSAENLIQNGRFEFIQDSYQLVREELDEDANELDDLIAQCEEDGIPTDYEKAGSAIIRRFIPLMDNEIQNEDYSRIEGYEDELRTLYAQAKANLEAYLSGEKTAVRVPRYVTGDVTSDGLSVLGTTFDGETTEVRPVFFVGFGPFEAASSDIPFFSKIGGSIIQTSIVTSMAIVPKRPTEWTYNSYCLYGSRSALGEEVNGVYASGTHSMKFTRPQNSSTCFAYIAQDIPVQPNTTYTYGLKAKGQGISTNAAHLTVGGVRTNLTDSADWRTYTKTYTTGENETSLRLMVRVEGYIGDALYVDDVYMKKSGTETNLLQNGDFETAYADGASAVDREAADLGISFDETQLNKLRSTLALAEENNIVVSVGASIDNVPEFFYERFSDITRTGTDFNYLNFPLNREELNRVFCVWVRKLASIMTDYESASDLVLANEPQLFAANESWYIPDWQAFLQDRYGTVADLNEAYGASCTNYPSFEAVIMPTQYEKTPLYRDYREFSNRMLTQFHQMLRDAVKNDFPDVKVDSKVMNYIGYSSRFNIQWVRNGNDYETMADMMDLNGCDAVAFVNPDYTGHASTYLKTAWYDYMTSLTEKPVWNSENHVLKDSDPEVVRYDEISTRHVATDVWNSAVHGVGGDVLWLWDLRNGNMPWVDPKYANTNFVHRPEAVSEIAKTALDLNRLSKEVTALQKAERKVGILYSQTAVTYDGDAYVEALADTYADTICSGQKVTFVVDSIPENMLSCELLIVPEATHVKEDMLEEIETYLDHGGKVLLMGEDALRYNEYGQDQDINTLSAIENHANTDTVSTVKAKISAMELSDITLVDADTGSALDDVEWMYTEYDGKYLVHAVNHSAEESVCFKVLYRGEEIGTLSDLRDVCEVPGEATLEPLGTVLLAFDSVELTLVDENGAPVEKNPEELRSGTYTCQSVADGTMILALYKDDTLIRSVIDDDTIEVTMDTSGRYQLIATVWDMADMTPLVHCKKLTKEVVS